MPWAWLGTRVLIRTEEGPVSAQGRGPDEQTWARVERGHVEGQRGAHLLVPERNVVTDAARTMQRKLKGMARVAFLFKTVSLY